ncbi:MAG: outer membrane lipoprotein LolB [Methylococcales bacterium]|jgi:outer membrane lipoprotein LolB|nr:outer membrane lipoprotein LolB [Methylococcales bacterium]MBT7443826.1 outer membrane lipoprotein LolB [Methylococcales bacterium]
MTKQVWLLAVIFLTGCSEFWVKPKPASVVEIDTNHWVLKGRLGVKSEEDAWSASFVWEQNQADYAIQIVAPLGQGTINITGGEQFVIAKYPDGQIIQYLEPDQVFQEALGVVIPVSSLRFWVMGQENKTTAAKIRRNPEGKIEEIIQDGWEVSYLRYSSDNGLPSKIFIEDDPVEVKLIIKEWEFGANDGG